MTPKPIASNTLTLLALLLATAPSAWADLALQTRHAALRIDDKGFITSLTNKVSGKEYSPAGHPSPLLSLHEDGQPNTTLLAPVSATFQPDKTGVTLKFPNGATASVKIAEKDGYFRFQLLALAPRDKVDNIVWGPLNTSISGKIGDIIGVVRDTDFAIGMFGLDDNTITGAVEEGDCYQMGYYIHSPDPVKFPVPEKY